MTEWYRVPPRGDTVYVRPNLSSKAALKRAVAAGDRIEVFSPGPFPAKTDGVEYVEGPHYPKPHSWYAEVEVKNGVVVKVRA
jgi:hypothetical protein